MPGLLRDNTGQGAAELDISAGREGQPRRGHNISEDRALGQDPRRVGREELRKPGIRRIAPERGLEGVSIPSPPGGVRGQLSSDRAPVLPRLPAMTTLKKAALT